MNPTAVARVIVVANCAAIFADAVGQQAPTRPPDIKDWRAFHRENDKHWARRLTVMSGWWGSPPKRAEVSPSDFREIRLLAGITDDEPSDPIVTLSGAGQLDRYLLLTVGSDGCFNAAVYGKDFLHFKQLWSSGTPSDSRDLCSQPACPQPQVSVDAKHAIEVMTFFRSAPDQPVCDQFRSVTYAPKGNSYDFESRRTGATNCWFVGSAEALDFAFRQAAGPGEILAVVQVLPALGPNKYALVFQRRDYGIVLLRMDLPLGTWPNRAEALTARKTASECFSEVVALPVKVTSLKIPEDRTQSLLTALGQIDLDSDRCARGANSECALLLDGRDFVVELGDSARVKLTDVKGLRGYVSENPRLSEWVYRLLAESKQESRMDAK